MTVKSNSLIKTVYFDSIALKWKYIVFSAVALLFYSFPVLANSSVCNKLSDNNKAYCEHFIIMNPGKYTTETLSGDKLINITGQDHKIYFIEADYLLPHSIILKNSLRILIFGIKNDLNLYPELKIKHQKSTSGNSEIIADIHQCHRCVISGFAINPDIVIDGDDEKTVKLQKIIKARGDNSNLYIHDIKVKQHMVGGYIDADGLYAIEIKDFHVDDKMDNDNLVNPAIAIRNTPNITMRDVSLKKLNPQIHKTSIGKTPRPPSEKIEKIREGIIQIDNPKKFSITDTSIEISSKAFQDTHNDKMKGLNIRFTKFDKEINVEGMIVTFKIDQAFTSCKL